MVKVSVRLQIHSGFSAASSDDVDMVRDIGLPFPPVEGLEVTDGEWGCVIEHICYDIKEKIYVVFAKEDKELYHRHRSRDINDEDRKKRLIEKTLEEIDSGWLIQRAPDFVLVAIKKKAICPDCHGEGEVLCDIVQSDKYDEMVICDRCNGEGEIEQQ